MTTVDSTFVAAAAINNSTHLHTGKLSLSKLDPSLRLDLPNHEVQLVWQVRDGYGRSMGLVFSARYEGEKRATWFACLNGGPVTSHLYLKRSEALAALEVLFAAYLLAGGMSSAKLRAAR